MQKWSSGKFTLNFYPRESSWNWENSKTDNQKCQKRELYSSFFNTIVNGFLFNFSKRLRCLPQLPRDRYTPQHRQPFAQSTCWQWNSYLYRRQGSRRWQHHFRPTCQGYTNFFVRCGCSLWKLRYFKLVFGGTPTDNGASQWGEDPCRSRLLQSRAFWRETSKRNLRGCVSATQWSKEDSRMERSSHPSWLSVRQAFQDMVIFYFVTPALDFKSLLPKVFFFGLKLI